MEYLPFAFPRQIMWPRLPRLWQLLQRISNKTERTIVWLCTLGIGKTDSMPKIYYTKILLISLIHLKLFELYLMLEDILIKHTSWNTKKTTPGTLILIIFSPYSCSRSVTVNWPKPSLHLWNWACVMLSSIWGCFSKFPSSTFQT